MFTGFEGKFGPFFMKNRAFLSNFYENQAYSGLLKPNPNILPQILENVPILFPPPPLAEYLKNIYHWDRPKNDAYLYCKATTDFTYVVHGLNDRL